jgi:hypothetical protein
LIWRGTSGAVRLAGLENKDLDNIPRIVIGHRSKRQKRRGSSEPKAGKKQEFPQGLESPQWKQLGRPHASPPLITHTLSLLKALPSNTAIMLGSMARLEFGGGREWGNLEKIR